MKERIKQYNKKQQQKKKGYSTKQPTARRNVKKRKQSRKTSQEGKSARMSHTQHERLSKLAEPKLVTTKYTERKYEEDPEDFDQMGVRD